MKKLLLISLIFLFGIVQPIFSQKQGQAKIDSLLIALKAVKADTSKVIILNSLSREKLKISDYQNARIYTEKAMQIAKKANYKKGIATSYYIIGSIYKVQGNYQEALRNYFNLLKTSEEEKNKSDIADSYISIGIIYHLQSNYPEALKNYISALKLKEEIGDKLGISRSYNNIGIIYDYQGNYAEALKNHFAALKIFKEIGDKKGIASSYSNIGIIYKEQKNCNEALKNHFESLHIQEEIGDQFGKACTFNNIGNIYEIQENYSEALKNYFASLKIKEELGDKYGIVNSFNNIGTIKLKMLQTKDAKEWMMKGLKLAKEIGSLELVKDFYKSNSQADSALGNFKGAFENYKLYATYNDSLFNEENTKKITQQQMQYEFDKKESIAKAVQEKKDAIALEELQKQKIIRNVFFGGLLIVLLFMFLIYLNYKKQRKTNEALDASNHKLDESIRTLENTNRILKETQQQLVHQAKLASLGALTAGIAHEIKNPLNFVNNFAELSSELIEEFETSKDEDERADLMKTIRHNMQKINEHGKRADGIVKSMLEHSRSGLAEKLPININQLCDEYISLAYHGKRATVPDFNCSIVKHFAMNLPLINVVSQDISRVILNLVNNAFDAMKNKHDARLEIITELVNLPFEGIRIRIRDNGSGMSSEIKQKIFEPFFTTKPTGLGTGLGLSLSFDIVKAHGGSIDVESEEGKGTAFIVNLNL
jgi:two-component system NtrC family sensor kinase